MSETIFGLISETARTTPEAPALLAPGRTGASFARLHRRILDMVERLNAIGVGRGDRVAIVLPNGPEAAIASLGVIAGAAAAPLNPDQPRVQIRRERILSLKVAAEIAADPGRADHPRPRRGRDDGDPGP